MTMGSLLDIVKRRCSVRDFSSKPVEKGTLEYILEAARMAPSAVNIQPISLYVIQSEPLLSEIKSCYGREWIHNAPVVIVACGDHRAGWHRADGKDHTDIDVAIAVDHLTLAATEMGIGTCWVCNFDAERCSYILGLSECVEPVVLIPMGYPTVPCQTVKKRKSMDEIVRYL